MRIGRKVRLLAAAAALAGVVQPMQTHATARLSASDPADSYSPLFARRLSVGIEDMDPPDDRLGAGIFLRDPVSTPASVNPGSLCLGSACLGSWCLGSACLNSGCLGSACFNSNCLGSTCAGSMCGGSACVGSVCGGSACVASSCARCSPELSHEIQVMG